MSPALLEIKNKFKIMDDDQIDPEVEDVAEEEEELDKDGIAIPPVDSAEEDVDDDDVM